MPLDDKWTRGTIVHHMEEADVTSFDPEAESPGGYDVKHEGPFDTEQQAQDIVRRKANKAMTGFKWEVQKDKTGSFYAVELEEL